MCGLESLVGDTVSLMNVPWDPAQVPSSAVALYDLVSDRPRRRRPLALAVAAGGGVEWSRWRVPLAL